MTEQIVTQTKTNGTVRAENILGLPISQRPWSAFITVTPEMAATILEMMPPQRAISRKLVAQYVAMLQSGQWHLSHQGIGFNAAGQLIDGQHRLKACATSGVDLYTMATFALSDRTFEVVDRGRKRSIADDLHVRGTAVGAIAAAVSGAARIIDRIDAGLSPETTTSIAGIPIIFNIEAADRVCARHPLLVKTVEWLMTHRVVSPKPPMGSFAAFVTLFREVDETLACLFAEQILTGEGLKQGDPALIIRESLVESKASRTAPPRIAFMYRVVRGWNAVRDGRTVRSLASGSIKDAGFPKISGYSTKKPVPIVGS